MRGTENKIYTKNNHYYFNTDNEYHIQFLNFLDSKFKKIKSFCKEAAKMIIDFSLNKQSKYMLFNSGENDSIWEHYASKKAYEIIDQKDEKFINNFDFIYSKKEKTIVVKIPLGIFIPVQ